jgi:GNAT superfamily N-acetyltransferase
MNLTPGYRQTMISIQTYALSPSAPEIAICARWRVAEFSDVLGSTIEDEESVLNALAADQRQQVVLFATCDSVAAGTCLLVTSEIDPCHAVSPWLAGLYVTPEFRRLGVGRSLVSAIVDEARARGASRVHLYTDDSEVPYYERLGWDFMDRVDWKGLPTNLMICELGT